MGEPRVYPDWVQTESEQKMHDSFIHFVWRIFHHLRLPKPTKRQRAIARFLQDGPHRRMIQAFRGIGKTWLTCIYALWRLYRNPQEKVLIVSANEDKATENAVFMQRLIAEVPELQFLRPRPGQRSAVLAFDVGPADASVAPSVRAAGITGQITGGRATILISDDVEVMKNSYTELMRERLAELVKEYDAVVVPEGFDIIYLGTPQNNESIYNTVRKRGYACRIWPARFPDSKQAAKYDGALAPDILEDLERGAAPGSSTDAERFSDQDLAEREASYGRSGFALQFMLDTSLSDAERYPLKQSDLIYTDVPSDLVDHEGKLLSRAEAPVRLVWSSAAADMVPDITNVGFSGDRLYRPQHISHQRAPFEGAVMVIDPSGRGKDRTAVCVLKALAGQLYLTMMRGYQMGYSPETLEEIALAARAQQVKHVILESNFGDGMFTKLIEPYFARVYPCTVEEVRSTSQKELRIISDVEPVLNQHRLAVDSRVIQEDLKVAEGNPQYSFLYQLTHITKQRGSLRHDDMVDVLALGLRHFRESAAVDHQRAEERHREKLRDKEFREFERGILGASGRAVNRWVSSMPKVLRRPNGR